MAAHGVVLLPLYVATALGVYALGRRVLGAAGPAALAAVGFAFSARLLDQSYNLQTMAVAGCRGFAGPRAIRGPALARARGAPSARTGPRMSSMNMLVFTGVAILVWPA